jgi:hypothetical protein
MSVAQSLLFDGCRRRANGYGYNIDVTNLLVQC